MLIRKYELQTGKIMYSVNISPEAWHSPQADKYSATQPSVDLPLSREEILTLIYDLSFAIGEVV